MVLSGPRAVAEMQVMIDSDPGRGWDPGTKLLSVSLQRRNEIEPPFDRILEYAGRTGRVVPLFFVKDPGELMRVPRKPELETMLRVMRGLLAVDDRGMLHPPRP